MISDLPDPVVPATKPWGPCAFSCRIKLTISSFPRSPNGTARLLYVSFADHRSGNEVPPLSPHRTFLEM